MCTSDQISIKSTSLAAADAENKMSRMCNLMPSPVTAGLKHHQTHKSPSSLQMQATKAQWALHPIKASPYELGGLPPKLAYHCPQAVKAATHAIVSAHI